MSGSVKAGDIWIWRGTTQYRITNLRLIADASGVQQSWCNLIDISTGTDAGSFLTDKIRIGPEWSPAASRGQKKYVTAYCSYGCGTVKLFTPGETITQF